MTLNQGCPSSNFSATSSGNSASLGGCIKRLRDQWSGGLQGRPRAHTSLIQDSLRAIACLRKDPKETATRYWVWVFFNKLTRSSTNAKPRSFLQLSRAREKTGNFNRNSSKWGQSKIQCHSESRTNASPVMRQWRHARLQKYELQKLPRCLRCAK